MTDYVKLLQSFRRSNKDRKLKIAQKAGFSSIEDYLNHLQLLAKEENSSAERIETPVSEETNKEKVKPTIHIADVIDCSGSMSGDKIRNAVIGVNQSIEKLKEDSTANYLYTLCHFSYYSDIKFRSIGEKVEEVSFITLHTRGMTALYDAIGETIERIGSIKKENEKVLINVFTDGDENDSRVFNSTNLTNLIELKKSEGYTITFVGTEFDTKTIVKKLKLDSSNTLSYDGSAEGLSKSIQATSVARNAYATAITDGLDVSTGFYKNLNNK